MIQLAPHTAGRDLLSLILQFFYQTYTKHFCYIYNIIGIIIITLLVPNLRHKRLPKQNPR